jgi:hypothetical protein
VWRLQCWLSVFSGLPFWTQLTKIMIMCNAWLEYNWMMSQNVFNYN